MKYFRLPKVFPRIRIYIQNWPWPLFRVFPENSSFISLFFRTAFGRRYWQIRRWHSLLQSTSQCFSEPSAPPKKALVVKASESRSTEGCGATVPQPHPHGTAGLTGSSCTRPSPLPRGYLCLAFIFFIFIFCCVSGFYTSALIPSLFPRLPRLLTHTHTHTHTHTLSLSLSLSLRLPQPQINSGRMSCEICTQVHEEGRSY